MKKGSKFQHSVLSAGGVGMIIAIGITLLFSLLIPFCVLGDVIKQETAMILVPVAAFISSFGCALTAGKMVNENKVPAICTGLGLYLLIAICGALLFFDGISGRAIVVLPVIALGGGVGLYLSIKKTHAKRQKVRHRKNR